MKKKNLYFRQSLPGLSTYKDPRCGPEVLPGAKGIHSISHNTVTNTRIQNLLQVHSRGLKTGAIVARFNLASLQRGKRKRGGGGVNISTGQSFIFQFQGHPKDMLIFTFRFLSNFSISPRHPMIIIITIAHTGIEISNSPLGDISNLGPFYFSMQSSFSFFFFPFRHAALISTHCIVYSMESVGTPLFSAQERCVPINCSLFLSQRAHIAKTGRRLMLTRTCGKK